MTQENIPAIQNRACVFTDYDEKWIASLLQNAADRAGVSLPFKAEIAHSVMLYLEKHYPLGTIPLDFLMERLRSSLQRIGLPRIAAALRKETPPVKIPLDALAHTCPLPLFFYTNLRRKIESLHQSGMLNCSFSGKEECICVLSNGKHGGKAAQRISEELDSFLRETAQASARPKQKASSILPC